MQDTAEELEFGDMIVLDLSHDMKDGHTKHHHLECKFMPELVPILLEEGIIEEKEVEEDKLLDFQDNDAPCPLMEEVIKADGELELRVDKLEKNVAVLMQKVIILEKKNKKKVNPQANTK